MSLMKPLAALLFDAVVDIWWEVFLEMWGELAEQIEARTAWADLKASCGVVKPRTLAGSWFFPAGGGLDS